MSAPLHEPWWKYTIAMQHFHWLTCKKQSDVSRKPIRHPAASVLTLLAGWMLRIIQRMSPPCFHHKNYGWHFFPGNKFRSLSVIFSLFWRQFVSNWIFQILKVTMEPNSPFNKSSSSPLLWTLRAVLRKDVQLTHKGTVIFFPLHTFRFMFFFFQTFGCAVCRIVANSDDYYPPTLTRRPHHQVALAGEWFSERCEVRPNAIFVTRRLLFSNNNRSWEGYYHHYADALCRKPIFAIYARGTYVKGSPSQAVQHAHNYDFKVVQLKLRADHQGIADTLNRPGVKCGIAGKWSLDVEQDLSITKGCRPLGLRVPHVEYELMKVEKDHHRHKLYIGQRPSDGKSPTTPDERPTSFQPPLVKCGPARSNNAYYGYQIAAQQVQQQQDSNSASPRFSPGLCLLHLAALLLTSFSVLLH